MENESALPLRDGGVTIVAVHVLFLVLASTTMGMRLWSRKLTGSPLYAEDWTALAGLIFFYGYTANSLYGTLVGGIGYHIEELATQPWRLQVILKTSLVNEITYAVGMGLLKCSLCILLARIFSVTTFRIMAWLLMGFCISWAIMAILIGFLICQPLAFNWIPTIKDGHCGNQNAGYAAVGVIDILTDVLIILLPTRMVLNLQLPRARKVALLGVFALGSVTIALSVVRIVVILRVDFSDVSYNVVPIEVWTICEYGTAVMVTCGPLLRPALEKMLPASLTWRYKTRPGVGAYSDHSGGGRRVNTGQFSRFDNTEMPLRPVARSEDEEEHAYKMMGYPRGVAIAQVESRPWSDRS